jgi:outer membrane protein
MTNNLKKIEKDLRSLAKRCKDIRYTKGLLLSFLMMGLLSFSEGLTSPGVKNAENSINQARKELNTSISDMKALFKEAKRENNKLLKGSNLELIQLMEQGDQVVKSPWSSWQYGMNYFYSNWRGTYKGRGDKKEKYPYEGIYRRSDDLFLRSISPNSRNYSRYVASVHDDPFHSATTSTTGLGNASWGIESSVFDQEPVTTLNLLATVRPKEINKQAPVVNLGTIEGPEEISFSITPPAVEINTPTIREVSFNPVIPVTTTLPGFLSFNMKMNSFCDGINSTNCDTDYIEGTRVTDSEITLVEDILDKKTNEASGYVWGNDSNKPAVMKNSAGKPFKIYFDVTEGKNVTVTKNLVIDSSAYRNDTDTHLITGNTPLNNISGNQTAYFLLGGSRIGSLDANNGSITNNAKVSLAGPYVTAFEIQTNNGAGTREIKNTGEINDEIEKIGYRGPNGLGGIKVPVKINNRYYYEGTNVEITANDMNYNGTSVNGVDQENTPGSFGNGIGGFARGADTGHFDANGIARSNYDNGGYMGYKIGLLLTHEDVDNGSTGMNKLTNTGKINFSGSNSIGMQVDAEGSTPNVQVLNSGTGSISISGRSYGMKWDSRVHGDSTLENAGSITTGGGYSAGIAVIEQQGKTGTDSIRAYQGKVKNTGGITVNGSNSIGMYLKVNAQDNITNTGTINVNGTANIGMRVDKGSVATDAVGDPSAINTGTITVTGKANIGMVSNGASKAQNTGGTITLTGTTGNSAGMYATGGGTVENTGTITGSGLTDTTGISVDTGSTGTNSGDINLSGSKIAGVYNAGTFTMTGGKVTTNGTGASIYATGTVNSNINAGTITSSGGSVGLFADNTSTINLGTATTAPTLVTNSGGLMFYNNPTSSAGAQVNKFNLLKDVSGKVNSGGLAFYLKNVNTAAQLKTALDNMILNKDLILSLKNGSYLFTVQNSSIGSGTEMKLSELPGVTTSGFTSVGTRVKIDNANSGNDYKILKITGGNILVDEDVNLETTTDKYRRIDKESSSIKVDSGKKIEGTSANQVAIGQRNTITANAADMKLINEGTIKLDGNKSTGIAGETGTIENKGIVTVNGEESTGLYGADGSVITNDTTGKINVGSKGAGILAQNDLNGTLKTTGKITVENKGDITANSNGVKVIGIYADNANKSSGSTVKHTSGNIDMLNSKGSLGIYTNNLELTSAGNIKVGDESAGINAVNTKTVISGGTVEVGTKSIGFILEGIGKTSTTTFDGQAAGTLKINGQNSLGYYLVNADANTATNFKDNLVFNPGNNKYTYIYVKGNSATDRSKLVYNQAGKTIDTDSSVFIFGKDSDIKLDTAFTLTSTKNKVVAAYLKDSGTLTNEGSIDLSGDKSVALYGEAGGAIVNNKDIKIGTNSVGIYNKGASTGENGAAGTITLDGDYGIGMRSDNATGNTENKGKIESSKLRAVGMSSSNGSNAMTNTGTIDFSGQESIGMHTDNLGTAGHAVTNNGTITLVDANDETKPNIGIYSEHSNDVIVNNGKIEAGKNTLGIYGKAGGNITLGSASETKVGDNGVSVFTTGGNVDILNGAKVETGANNGVGVYYSGSNGTITNNTDKITIGDNSFGFVIKGGTNNKFFSNSTGTVQLPDKSVYLYSADTTGTENTVINRTNLESTGGELAYGIYTNGGGANYGNINMTQGKGHVGIYSYLPHPTGAIPATVTPNVFKNYGRIDVSASDLTVATDQKNGIGMAAGYVKQRTEVENVLDANGNVIIDPVTGNPKTQTKIYRDIIGLGNIENHGTISVTTPNSIGMYAGGKGSIAKNYGRIELSGTDLNVGMFLEDGAVGYNYGTITTVGTGNSEQVGVAVLRDATFHNYGKVNIDAEDGIGIAIGGKLTLVNRGEFTISGDRKTANMNNGTGTVTTTGDGSVAIATISDDSKIMGVLPVNQVGIIPKDGTYEAVVTYNGVEVPNVQTVDVIPDLARGKTTIQTAPIGIYVDTTGVNATRPVNNLGLLSTRGIKYADLIIGTEAAEQTNEKYLKLSKDLIAPYNDMILQAQRQGLRRWQIYSSSLTWMAKAVQNKDTQVIENLYLVKVPYTVWVGQQSTPINSSDTYNFADGLDQRYGVEALGSRERKLFEKLNSIGNNEHILLSQAFDEMMGHQYGNTQQRMQATGTILDKEFTHLKKEWENKSKQSNKIKTFGSRGEYKTDTAGIIDYTNNAYGVAYVHEDETIKLGNSSGWYAGAVTNRFKLKDIGKSKEDTTMLKLGVFKTMSPSSDHNGNLQWTISGEGYASISDMHRRYLVVDEIFGAKSTYYTYGVALKNELGYNIRTSERTSIRPYGSLKLEYGRFNGIKEKTGEIRLEIQSNNYHSIKPEVGIEFKYKQPMAVKTSFVTTLGLAYENELGKVGDVNNKGRVRFTNADWFGIRGEKDDRKGNFKADLNLGIENQRIGFTVNAGYDTKGKNIRGGIGLRAIF